MQESKFKKIEILFCWSEFYCNSPHLAVPTQRDNVKFSKIKKEIDNLKKQVID